MILYPAIDLKDGACVRLVRGEMASATVFNRRSRRRRRGTSPLPASPGSIVVDLDGAFAGRSVNGDAVAAIRRAVDLPSSSAAASATAARSTPGWRSASTAWSSAPRRCAIPAWSQRAAARLSRPDRRRHRCARRPGRGRRLGGDVDRDRRVELARALRGCGVAAIVYTDIERDGALAGVDVAATAALARGIETPVIASGGVASLADIAALKAREADGIAGVICGRALYDGRIDPRRGVALAASADGRPPC